MRPFGLAAASALRRSDRRRDRRHEKSACGRVARPVAYCPAIGSNAAGGRRERSARLSKDLASRIEPDCDGPHRRGGHLRFAEYRHSAKRRGSGLGSVVEREHEIAPPAKPHAFRERECFEAGVGSKVPHQQRQPRRRAKAQAMTSPLAHPRPPAVGEEPERQHLSRYVHATALRRRRPRPSPESRCRAHRGDLDHPHRDERAQRARRQTLGDPKLVGLRGRTRRERWRRMTSACLGIFRT